MHGDCAAVLHGNLPLAFEVALWEDLVREARTYDVANEQQLMCFVTTCANEG
jgi:hypothetical protein